MTTSTCSLAEEYIVRVCSAARAKRTCEEVWIVSAGINARCSFKEQCMRCVPAADVLGKASCTLDSMSFFADGNCPQLLDASTCDDCASIVMQEVCIGLCSINCKWANVSWMQGEHCSIREPPTEEEDNTLMMILMIGGGAVGGLVFCIGLRLLCKMRQRALEASRHEANREARKEAMGRTSGASSQDSKARLTADERARLSAGSSEDRASLDFGERGSVSTSQTAESEQTLDKPEQRGGFFRPKFLRKMQGGAASSKGQDEKVDDRDANASDEEDGGSGDEDGDDEEGGSDRENQEEPSEGEEAE